MINNEKIAKWLGYEISHPVMGGVAQSMMVKPPKMREWVPDYDKHITLWHGEDGLLAEIEKKGHNRAVMFVFYLRDVFKMEKGETNFWKYMTATPAQLAVALVKMIEEGE